MRQRASIDAAAVRRPRIASHAGLRAIQADAARFAALHMAPMQSAAAAAAQPTARLGGTVVALMQSMQAQLNDTAAVVWYLNTLQMLLTFSDVVMDEASCPGLGAACAAVAAAMRAHTASTDLQVAGCRALASMYCEPAPQLLDAVMGALRQHEAHPGVLRFGLRALSCMVAGHEDLQRRAGEAGAVEMALAALRDASAADNAAIQQAACAALANLLMRRSNRNKKARTAAAVRDVVAVMRASRGIAGVQMDCCRALRHMVACIPACNNVRQTLAQWRR